MKRVRSMLLRPPVTFALMFLGMVFVIFYPAGRDWTLYVLALIVAGLYGLWARRRYQVTVLEDRTTEEERVLLIRQRLKKGRGRLGPEPPPGEPPAPMTRSGSPPAQPEPPQAAAPETVPDRPTLTDSF